jgi:hypothetical protein
MNVSTSRRTAANAGWTNEDDFTALEWRDHANHHQLQGNDCLQWQFTGSQAELFLLL